MRAALRGRSSSSSRAVKIVMSLVSVVIVAAIAIPNLLEPTCVQWFDTSAQARLRNLVTVQAQFQASGVLDADGDGIGEFGTFGMLAGAGRDHVDASGRNRGPAVDPPLLSPMFRQLNEEGVVIAPGYCYRIVLPAKNGGPTREGALGRPLLAAVDVDGSEHRWCAYAWPGWTGGELKGRARFHNRVFFVDESGDVWQTMNQDQRYAGPSGGPSWDAAMPEDGWGAAWKSPPPDVEYRGRDGNVWKRTN